MIEDLAIEDKARGATVPRLSRFGCLRLLSLLLAVLVALPVLVIIASWLHPQTEIWRHLADTVLLRLLLNTLVLLLGVGIGVLLIGVGLAWLTAMCEFPGRRFFEWALLLPLAVPAYVLAFVALGTFDFTGPVQTLLRQHFGVGGYWFPEVRSRGGVIVVMVLVFYPYVYMLARAAFLTQGRATLEAARVLGYGPWGAFFHAVLPMARPAIATGAAIALMETLADFGAVSVFNYDTFTTAIYKAWFGLFSLQAASQLASLLLLFVALALISERYLRRRARFHESPQAPKAHAIALHGWRAWLAFAAASMVFFFAFALPVWCLGSWAYKTFPGGIDVRYLELLIHTLMLGAAAAVITIACALLLAYARRRHADRLTQTAIGAATLGYALPGAVLAVGIMLVFTSLDNAFIAFMHWFDENWTGRLLGGTVVALLLAYTVRFLAVAFGPIESGLGRIHPSLGEAARNLGASPLETVWRIHLPLLRPGLLTA
ncbi:MAG: iron ABC transporter permease, partial [Chromatiales bacterium]|nr:iron ABC transporter permease [Chromatiales bacterium]